MDVIEIKSLLDEADNADAIGSTNRWNAAEGIVEQLDAGATQVALAAELERSRAYVQFSARVWREQGSIGDHVEDLEHNFWAAFRWAQSNPANPRQPRSTPSTEPEVRPAPTRSQAQPEEPAGPPPIQINYGGEAEPGINTNPLNTVGDAIAADKCIDGIKAELTILHALVTNQANQMFQEAILAGLLEIQDLISSIRMDVSVLDMSAFE